MSAAAGVHAIDRFLDRLRLLLWAASALRALSRVGAVAAVALVLNVLVAERSPAGPWTAFSLSLAGTLALALAVVRYAPSLAVPARAAAARRAQQFQTPLRNDVESSLELAPRAAAGDPAAGSPHLIGALVASTASALGARPARSFVRWRGPLASLLLLAAASLPLGALALSGGIPPEAARALVDPRIYWPLGRVRLEVEPGETRIARGADLRVRVRASGARPGSVSIGYEGATGAGLAAMERGTDGAWSWRFAAVADDFRYRALAGGAASPWYRVRVADAPAAGTFEVVYTFPAYSGLGTRRVTGSGDLEALKGTSAEIFFSSTVGLAQAWLVTGTNRVPVRPAGEGRYRTALYLGGESAYRLELEDAEGLGNGGAPEYAIRYLPDQPPVVEVSEPAGEIEGDPRALVTVRYRAADDFGLSRLALVVCAAGGERRHPLTLAPSARVAGGEYVWDLGALEATPGDVVTAFVEAADNDTISGPKTAASAPFAVRIADPRVKREQMREDVEKLTDDLVALLGDALELQGRYEELEQRAEGPEAVGEREAAEAVALQRQARDAATRAGERAGRLADQLALDPSAREEAAQQAELIRQGLADLLERQLAPMEEMAAGLRESAAAPGEQRQKAGFLASSAEQAARKAEQLTLMAEAMRRGQGLEGVARGAEEMAEAEDRLLESLDQLSPQDRAAAAEVLRQLERIEQALRELAQALQEQSKELPEEFLNSDALEGLDLGEALEGLEQVRQLLKQGDVAGARQAARALAKQLSELRERLRQAGEEVDERARQALERLRRGAVPRLQGLADRQRAVLERTEAVERQAGPRLEQRLRELARAQVAAPVPAESDLLTPEERGRTQALAHEQLGLRDTAQALAAELAALRAALPFLPVEIERDLAEAGGHMGEAGGRLGGHEPALALPPERSALAALERASRQAAEALDQLDQMQQMRQGAAGMPFGMGMGSSSPGGGSGGSRPERGHRSGGRRGMDVRNFVIPGRQDHQVPKVFREEIMKSLQDGYPPPYEERIKDYYQRIAE